MTSPRVSVIVVTYNSRSLLRDCLTPLTDVIAEGLAELIVVDNMSNDDPESAIVDLGIAHTFIQSGANKGFSVAVNIGARRAVGRYLLLLNPDVAHGSSVLRELIGRLDDDHTIGAIAPLLISPRGVLTANGGQQPRLFPIVAHLSGAAWLLRHIAPRIGHYVYADVAQGKSLEVGWLSGGYLLTRSRFMTNELVSERWFMYAEDIDLCRYISQQGSRLLLCGEVTAGHAIGGSSENAASQIKTLWLRSLHDYYRAAFRPSWLTAQTWRLAVGAGYRARAAIAYLKQNRSRGAAFLSYARALNEQSTDFRMAIRPGRLPRSVAAEPLAR